VDTQQQLHYLKTLGIRIWVPSDFAPQLSRQRHLPEQQAGADAQLQQQTENTRAPVTAQSDWPALEAKVQSCTACDLHADRTQTVFGTGDPNARIMVIGEAPGAEEDVRGEPFVGRAGRLLNEMLKAIGLQREQVYITNIIKCRPPANRNPLQEEAYHCAPYLQRQIALVAPRVIFAVGKIAARDLLKIDQPISKMRGKLYSYAPLDIPVIVTYHPAYLLRSPREKRKSWQDLKRLKAQAG